MAKIDVPQSDYWHVSLKGHRWAVGKALEMFPSSKITQNKGLFYKNVRAYHSGGAVLIDRKKAGETCLECEFPSAANSVEHYFPVGSLGFKFDRNFHKLSAAELVFNNINFGAELSKLKLFELRGSIFDLAGRKYSSEDPMGYHVGGVVASAKIENVLEFYNRLKDPLSSCSVGSLKFSTNSREFDLEKAFDF